MAISEPDIAEAKSDDQSRSSSLWRSQQKAILAWMLALPIGWLFGWGSGAAIGYSNPALLDPFTLKINSYTAHKIGASDGGLLGGAIGVMVGFGVAAWITMLSLRIAIPALRPMQVVIAILAWTLPMILFLAAAYFLF